MSHEFSLDVLVESGVNIMDPENYSYKVLKEKLGHAPLLKDFPDYMQHNYHKFLTYMRVVTLLLDPKNTFHIRLNHGARSGSIARIVNAGSMITKRINGYMYNNCQYELARKLKLELAWDDGKTWVVDFYRSMDSRTLPKGAKRHDILINYTGPTIKKFEKKQRVVLPPAENPDAYGRIIKIDDWVMDNRFRIGRITRISDKGTMWIKFVQQSLGDGFSTKSYVEQFGRSSRELLILDLPEGFETTALILDNDVRDFVITPTFRFDYQ